MKVVIYNDTVEKRIHFGCQLVMESFREQLDRVGIELIGTVPIASARRNEYDPRLLEKADLVIVNGEGSLHHNRRNDLVHIAKKYPSVLVNTVYEANTNITQQDLSHFKYISARESMSATALGCDVVPDVIFTASRLKNHMPQPNIDHGFIEHFNNIRTLQPAESFLNMLVKHSKISTGSFHGGCLCLYYGIPFKSWDSNTYKIQGLMQDAGLQKFHRHTKSELSKIDISDFPPVATGYVSSAQAKINTLFEDLHNYG